MSFFLSSSQSFQKKKVPHEHCMLILCRHGGVCLNLRDELEATMTSTDLYEATMTSADVVNEDILNLVDMVEVILSSSNPEEAISDLYGCYSALNFSSVS
jgi:hypothetical protein